MQHQNEQEEALCTLLHKVHQKKKKKQEEALGARLITIGLRRIVQVKQQTKLAGVRNFPCHLGIQLLRQYSSSTNSNSWKSICSECDSEAIGYNKVENWASWHTFIMMGQQKLNGAREGQNRSARVVSSLVPLSLRSCIIKIAGYSRPRLGSVTKLAKRNAFTKKCAQRSCNIFALYFQWIYLTQWYLLHAAEQAR